MLNLWLETCSESFLNKLLLGVGAANRPSVCAEGSQVTTERVIGIMLEKYCFIKPGIKFC